MSSAVSASGCATTSRNRSYFGKRWRSRYARRNHPALQRLRSIQFHGSNNDSIICYSKVSDDGDDVVLVVCNLDPDSPQETTLWLDLPALGLPESHPYEAYDELTRQAFTWWGPSPYVRLDPAETPAHVLHLRAVGGR